ncbi:hypothetical protein [Mycobacterium avium]|uniref:hypothetical protein n=1 Tax=Mycobacterium avium TaxID=1764 RepID=UPI000CE49A70|nr:hypothetical protein [Mycobacterium avium]
MALIAHDVGSAALVRAPVPLADNTGAHLVAGGAEHEDPWNALLASGSNFSQGCVHTPPLPPDELRAWTASHAPDPSQSRG